MPSDISHIRKGHLCEVSGARGNTEAEGGTKNGRLFANDSSGIALSAASGHDCSLCPTPVTPRVAPRATTTKGISEPDDSNPSKFGLQALSLAVKTDGPISGAYIGRRAGHEREMIAARTLAAVGFPAAPTGATGPQIVYSFATVLRVLRCLLWLVVLADCAVAAASTSPKHAAATHPDIVLITLDTTRAPLACQV
jgi:hypothetical protein